MFSFCCCWKYWTFICCLLARIQVETIIKSFTHVWPQQTLLEIYWLKSKTTTTKLPWNPFFCASDIHHKWIFERLWLFSLDIHPLDSIQAHSKRLPSVTMKSGNQSTVQGATYTCWYVHWFHEHLNWTYQQVVRKVCDKNHMVGPDVWIITRLNFMHF